MMWLICGIFCVQQSPTLNGQPAETELSCDTTFWVRWVSLVHRTHLWNTVIGTHNVAQANGRHTVPISGDQSGRLFPPSLLQSQYVPSANSHISQEGEKNVATGSCNRGLIPNAYWLDKERK